MYVYIYIHEYTFLFLLSSLVSLFTIFNDVSMQRLFLCVCVCLECMLACVILCRLRDIPPAAVDRRRTWETGVLSTARPKASSVKLWALSLSKASYLTMTGEYRMLTEELKHGRSWGGHLSDAWSKQRHISPGLWRLYCSYELLIWIFRDLFKINSST